MTEEGSGREHEVLKARRESRERLGDRAFALSLEQALGVRDTDTSADIRAAHGSLAADTLTDDRRTVAGRIVLKRDLGKLVFLVLRDRAGDIQLVVQPGHRGREPLVARRDRSRRHRRCDRPRRHDAERRAVDLRRTPGHTHEVAAAVAREVARPEGPRPPAAAAVPAPRDRSRLPAGGRRPREGAPHDPLVPRRARVRRGRDARPAEHRRRRDGQALRHAPRGARHRPVPADLARAVPEATARRRARARVRDRPQLPQRGDRPQPQPRVHDARALSVVRGLRDRDADHPRARAAIRARGERVARGDVPRRGDRSRG